MRIITYNVNGIRSAIRKGFLEWLTTDPAEVICLQEIKAVKDNIDASFITKMGFHQYWFPAQKKGYSGVAVFSKVRPKEVHYGNGYLRSDEEGRVLKLDFQQFSLVNTYFPSGTSGRIRQGYKYQWLDDFLDYVNQLRKTNPRLIVAD